MLLFLQVDSLNCEKNTDGYIELRFNIIDGEETMEILQTVANNCPFEFEWGESVSYYVSQTKIKDKVVDLESKEYFFGWKFNGVAQLNDQGLILDVGMEKTSLKDVMTVGGLEVPLTDERINKSSLLIKPQETELIMSSMIDGKLTLSVEVEYVEHFIK